MLSHHCHPGNIVISFVVDAFATKFLPSIYAPLLETIHSGTVLYPSVVIDEFGGVPLRDNVSGILMVITSSYTVQNRSVSEKCIFHDGAQLLHQW